MMENVLHVYAQEFWHTDAYIVGQRDALTELRDCITVALQGNGPQQMEAMVNDGEGYGVWVVVRENLDDLALPYTDDAACNKGEGIWPAALVPREATP